MPHADGREVARAVKNESRGPPVILLTGWGMRLRAGNHKPAAVDLMLSKRPTFDALNRALEQVTSGDRLAPWPWQIRYGHRGKRPK
jgi:DNA-binding NarL/FixJ family response regulator